MGRVPNSPFFDVLGQASDFLNGILALIGTTVALSLATLRVIPRARLGLVTSHLTTPVAGAGRGVAERLGRSRVDTFRRVAREVARGDDVRAAEAVHRVFPDMQGADPWQSQGPLALLEWCDYASRPGRESFLGRLAVPDQLTLVREFITDVADYLEAFARLSPVPTLGDRAAASSFATHLSGAVVLVDASDSRSGVAGGVLARHSAAYRGQRAVAALPEGEPGGYGATHPLRGVGSRQPQDRLGDYDGRLPDLVGAGVATSVIDGAVVFVLDTAETCYRASEDPGELGCKRLSGTSDDDRAPRFESVTSGWLSRRPLEEQRVSILTSYVTLLARGEATSDGGYQGDVLVLCRRSTLTRNGQGTLSATAGGLVELGADLSMDVTSSGAPDPIAAAVRECKEELGLVLDRRLVNPTCVFLCTVQGRNPSADPRSERDRGQLVSVVLSLAAVPMTLSELCDAQRLADHAVGGFEVDALEGIAMPSGEGGCAEFAASVSALSQDLDQHGLLSCFYAAIRRYGREETLRCFSHAFETAWWSQPWSGETSVPRVCRDPRTLVAQPEDQVLAPEWERLTHLFEVEAVTTS